MNEQETINKLPPEKRAAFRAYVQQHVAPQVALAEAERKLEAAEHDLENVEQQEPGEKRIRDAALTAADSRYHEVELPARQRRDQAKQTAEERYQQAVSKLPLAQARQAVQDAEKVVEAAKAAVHHKSV